ncbi:hypothetical protein ACOMHN_037125 [Nucella lapillus]
MFTLGRSAQKTRAGRHEVAHPRTPRDVHTQPPVLKSTFGDVAQLKSPIPCTDDEKLSPHRADGCGQAQVTQPSSHSEAEGSREVPLAESRDADSRNDSRRPHSCWGTLMQLNTPVTCTESDGCGQAQVTQPSSHSEAEGSREVPLAESRDADSRNDSRRPHSCWGTLMQLNTPVTCTESDGCGQAQVTQPSSHSEAEGSREVPLAESRDADSRNDSRRPHSCWGTLMQLNTPVTCTESVATVPVDGKDDVGGATAETHVEDPKITAPPSRMAMRNRYSLHMPCTDDINEATLEQLLRENQRLRRLRECRRCQVLRFQAIIYPCGHLVCEVCLYCFWPSCPCCPARPDYWFPARLD